MIAMIQGALAEKSEGEAVVLAGGVGYRLMCSMNTLAALPAVGQNCKLLTHLSVREDAMELYGFTQREERELFRMLITVSGVGPRTALFVLGSMPLSDLRMAILTADLTALSRAPGIGKKTAQRIALELKDRVAKSALSAGLPDADILAAASEAPAGDALGEAMQALKALGYSPQEATAALKGVKGDTADELIRLALRNMAQQK